MHLIAQSTYRSRQLLAALLGRVSRAEMAEALSVLGPAPYTVFASMPRQYRRHALAVYNRVRKAGCNDLPVLQAALLHDCGKHDPVSGRYVTVVHRVLVVALENLPGGNLLSRVLASLGKRNPNGRFLYPFYLSRNHPRLGAELAASAGALPQVVALIAEHHNLRPPVPESPQNRHLQALQAADDAS